jgi:hypothetical protein
LFKDFNQLNFNEAKEGIKKNKKMILYRGIAVERAKVNEVISNIEENGIIGNEGFWNFIGWNLRKDIERLFHKQDLTLDDTRKGFEEFPVVAFADKLGAYYYALRHNYEAGRIPLIIKVEINASKKYVYIDGRDFLYPVFQGWDHGNLVKRYGIQKTFEIVAKTLKQIYGDKLIKYFQKAAVSKEQSYRIAMCDLATHDIDIVKEHLNNKILIGGRYNVVFRSSFFVEAPITPDEIVKIFVPNASKFDFNPQIQIYKWL